MANGKRGTATLTRAMLERVERHPESILYRWLNEKETEMCLTVEQVHRKALAVMDALTNSGSDQNRAILAFKPGLEFISAFLGCLYKGILAVPVNLPRTPRQASRIRSIMQDCDPTFILTTSDTESPLQKLVPEYSSRLTWLATDTVPERAGTAEELGDYFKPAYLQYTSGSTSEPRGAIISHGNAISNLQYIFESGAFREESSLVSWLPAFHDLGLLVGFFLPIYSGIPATLFSPIGFRRSPVRWLEIISRYRASHSGGPDSAYQLCVQNIQEEDIQTLDLSSWEVAFNGAEPVRLKTIETFTDKFQHRGFSKRAFYPVYGLAEATLKVSSLAPGEGIRTMCVDADEFKTGKIVEATTFSCRTHTFVSVGTWGHGTDVRIVDPTSCIPLPSDRIGEIWVSGPGVSLGYWNQPELTAETMRAIFPGEEGRSFLRTGDMGFVSAGQLFITGRLKDLLIIRGENIYPQDLEIVAESSSSAISSGKAVAFAVATQDADIVAIACEVNRNVDQGEYEAIAIGIKKAVHEEYDILCHLVYLLAPASLLFTSSGKIQRNRCRDAILAGDIIPIFVSQSSKNLLLGGFPIDTWRIADEPTQLRLLRTHLRRVASELLGIPEKNLEPNTSLVSQGLDSLAALQLANYLQRQFGASIPSVILLDPLGIDALTQKLNSQLAHLSTPRVSPVRTSAIEQYSLSSNQSSIWAQSTIRGDSSAFNIATALRIRGPIDIAKVKRVFDTLVQRHDALRTVFIEDDTGVRQYWPATSTFQFTPIDARNWSEAEMDEFLRGQSARSMSLENDQLFVVQALLRNAEETVLLVIAHHIISDFRSFDILLAEFSELYLSLDDVHRNALPAAEQYRLFLDWERQRVASGANAIDLQFWETTLKGQLPDVPFKPTVAQINQSKRLKKSHHFTIDQTTTKALIHEANREGVTLYAKLLSVFAVLVYRRTGLDDVIVAVPSYGRELPQFSHLVGYCVNPILLRLKIKGSFGFDALSKDVHTRVIDALTHGGLPFALLSEHFRHSERGGLGHFLNTMFLLRRSERREWEGIPLLADGWADSKIMIGPLEIEGLPVPGQPMAIDFGFSVTEYREEFHCTLDYVDGLYEESVIVQISRQFALLAAAFSAQPDMNISEVSLIENDEADLIQAWNKTVTDYDLTVPLHLHIEAQSRRTPDRIAISDHDGHLTYRELNENADVVAGNLRSISVNIGDVVGICSQRNLTMVVILLGILKSGAAYLPIDPDLPDTRVQSMVHQAHCNLIIYGENITHHQVQKNAIDVGLLTSGVSSAQPVVNCPTPVESPAYVIFTSGSTGQPKGVMISHQAICNRLLWMQDTFNLKSEDVVLQKTPFTFDVSVWEIFWPLMVGAKVVLARHNGHIDSGYLLGLMKQEKVSIAHFVPSMLAMFLDQHTLNEVSSLQKVICSGEDLKVELARRFFANSQAELFNLYGPTEAAVDATFWRCQPTSNVVLIGSPISNMHAYVLDKCGSQCAIGQVGELFLAGRGLAIGYSSRPDLTAERFLPDVFSGRSGSRMYATGDLARFERDGSLEFLGRADRQIKIRGVRIELDEIESVVSSVPEVEQCAVVRSSGREYGDLVIAYVCLRRQKSGHNALSEIASFVRSVLPPSHVPNRFIQVNELPLTSSGKIDRRQIERWEHGHFRDDTRFVAPRTPVEEELAAIWRELLRVDKVGVHDHFLELGGDSLLIMQLGSRIKEAFHVTLPARTLFEQPTIAEITLAMVLKIKSEMDAKSMPGASASM